MCEQDKRERKERVEREVRGSMLLVVRSLQLPVCGSSVSAIWEIGLEVKNERLRRPSLIPSYFGSYSQSHFTYPQLGSLFSGAVDIPPSPSLFRASALFFFLACATLFILVADRRDADLIRPSPKLLAGRLFFLFASFFPTPRAGRIG